MLLNHTDEKLVRMANQIATFFLSQPEDIRVEGVATHINKFWEPRMRKRFFEMVDAGAGEFLPLVLAAALKIKKPGVSAADAVGLGNDARERRRARALLRASPCPNRAFPKPRKARR